MQNNIFSSDRPFQVWGYLVSHDQLLLRSPIIKGYEKNIDIIFFGVTYLQIDTDLSGLTIQKVDPADAEIVHNSVKQSLIYDGNNLFEILSNDEGYLIVAGFVRVFENDLEFGESSLGFTELGREIEIARIS